MKFIACILILGFVSCHAFEDIPKNLNNNQQPQPQPQPQPQQQPQKFESDQGMLGSYGPSSYGPAPSYHAPAPVYHAPAPAYHAPAPAYHAPAPVHHAPVYPGPSHTYSYGSPAPQVPCGKHLLASCVPSVAPVPCVAPKYSSHY